MSRRVELTPSQRRRCNRLIKKLCANYDGENCLPLDEGDGCVCVQMISLSLICKYFRNAVLPADKELYADIFRQRTYYCVECGAVFCRIATGRNTARLAAKKSTADRKTKARRNLLVGFLILSLCDFYSQIRVFLVFINRITKKVIDIRLHSVYQASFLFQFARVYHRNATDLL